MHINNTMKRQVLVIFVCISCFIKQCTNQHLNENQDNLRVKTNVGDFKGLYFTTEFGTEKYQVLRFLGIRYAKKTTGKLRFMKPEPFTYSEPHEARHYGSSCPQIDMMGLGVDSEDEDCLFLNLFIPTEAPDRETGHSVVVFIHGGGFEFGSSSVFPGDSLAALGNIIVVTFNYRIGIFGFLNTGDETFRGNAGLWDQRLAIKWVKDHIRNFGGDPDRITILGESSGAMSAVIHGMYPENKGLFQNIIAISGTPFTPPGLPSNNLISAQYFAQLVVCYPNGESFRKCMQDADISYLMQSVRYAAEDVDKWSRLNFFPTVDGELIKQDPINRLKQDQSFLTNEVKFLRSLNLIVGLNDAEGGMWVMHMGNDSTGSSISNEDMTEFIIPDTLPFVIDFEQNIPSLTKKLVQAEYSNWENPKDARMQYVKFKGDINYNVPAISLAQFHSDHNAAKTWLFKLDALLNKHVLPTPVWLEKAIHGDILVPLFGFHANFTYGQFRHVFKYEPEEWELQLSMRLITYISNFIRTGDPDIKKDSAQRKTNEKWSPYNQTTQHFVSFKRDNVRTGQYLFAREVNFWKNLVPLTMKANITDEKKISEKENYAKVSDEYDIFKNEDNTNNDNGVNNGNTDVSITGMDEDEYKDNNLDSDQILRTKSEDFSNKHVHSEF